MTNSTNFYTKDIKNENKPKVYVIILNWNNWEDTLECIESVLNNNYHEYQIVVVDNKSTDDSLEELRKWLNKNSILFYEYEQDFFNNEVYLEVNKKEDQCYEQNIEPIIIIKSDKNRGYAGGNNLGIRYALNQNDMEYVWVLNNDTKINEDCLSELIEYASKNTSIGLIGSTILEYKNPSIVQCAGGAKYNVLLTLNKPMLEGESLENIKKEDLSIKLDYISGCSMFFRREIIEKVGLLNENYFLYYEEIDYSKRLKGSGYSIGWCKGSYVLHKFGSTTNKGDIKKSDLSEYYSNLSALKFTITYYKFIFPIVAINRFLLKCIKFIKNKEFKLFKPLINSYIDFVTKKNNN